MLLSDLGRIIRTWVTPDQLGAGSDLRWRSWADSINIGMCSAELRWMLTNSEAMPTFSSSIRPRSLETLSPPAPGAIDLSDGRAWQPTRMCCGCQSPPALACRGPCETGRYASGREPNGAQGGPQTIAWVLCADAHQRAKIAPSERANRTANLRDAVSARPNPHPKTQHGLFGWCIREVVANGG